MNILKTLFLIFGVILGILTLLNDSASAQNTPASWPTTWTPVTMSNNTVVQDSDDINGSNSGYLDIYYSDSPHHASAYVAFENNTCYFRLNLQQSPGTVTSLQNATWIAQIKNLNTGNVGAVLLDGSNERIIVSRVSSPTAQDVIYSYSSSSSTFSNAVAVADVWPQPTVTAVSNSGENHYLDFQVPIAALNGGSTQLEISATTPVQFFFGTSQALANTGVINKDWMVGGSVSWSSLDSTTFSTITGSPLPVELTSFKAYLKNDVTELRWNTATETNNFGFHVERSKDGESWGEIGFVRGAGNSQVPLDYAYTDSKLPRSAKNLYYRLRQVDRDGTTEYSPVTMVKNCCVSGVKITDAYPNPFNPTTTVSFSLDTEGPLKLSLYDMTGAEVNVIINEAFHSAGSHAVTVNAGNLPSGKYFLVLQSAQKLVHYPVVLMK